MNTLNISIIGVGKMGGALALALANKGYKIRQLVAKNRTNAERIARLIKSAPQIINPNQLEKVDGDIVFIAVQDSEIENVSEDLAEKLDHLPFVLHLSGALSSKILFRLSDEGCEVASFHPLVSISDSIKGADNFQDAYFCLEGDIEAIKIGKQIVADLQGKSFSISPKDKSLYHAAAVTACGHLVSLFSTAVQMLADCGLERDKAQEILLPLVKSTISNLETQTPAQALTGTFARADVETLQNHIQSLRENESEEIFKTYLQLGFHSLQLAKEQGANEEKLKQMQQILESELLIKVK